MFSYYSVINQNFQTNHQAVLCFQCKHIEIDEDAIHTHSDASLNESHLFTNSQFKLNCETAFEFGLSFQNFHLLGFFV